MGLPGWQLEWHKSSEVVDAQTSAAWCHRGQDATRCPCGTRLVIAPKQGAVKAPLEPFSRSSEEAAIVPLALLSTPHLPQSWASRTTSNPRSFPRDALTMPNSATLAPLTCLLQLLLWFVLTFAVAQKSESAPEKPTSLTAHTAMLWPRRPPSFERPPAPVPLSLGPERWLRDCDVHPSRT